MQQHGNPMGVVPSRPMLPGDHFVNSCCRITNTLLAMNLVLCLSKWYMMGYEKKCYCTDQHVYVLRYWKQNLVQIRLKIFWHKSFKNFIANCSKTSSQNHLCWILAHRGLWGVQHSAWILSSQGCSWMVFHMDKYLPFIFFVKLFY